MTPRAKNSLDADYVCTMLKVFFFVILPAAVLVALAFYCLTGART